MTSHSSQQTHLPAATALPYRPSVVGVFINHSGNVLVLERVDTPGAWQFPQGGIEEKETPLTALRREMTEELGCENIRVMSSSSQQISYDFPPDLGVPICQHYRGQTAWWFLCGMSCSGPHLHRATDAEFCAHRWIKPQEAPEAVVFWKRKAYRQGLVALKLISA